MELKHIGRVLTLGLLTLAWRSAEARTLYVSPVGTNNYAGYYPDWRGAATTITAAVARASSGDVVLVTNGTYMLTSSIVITKGITLRSWNNGVQDRVHTVLNGSGVCAPLYVSKYYFDSPYLPMPLVAGFTITNGNGVGGLDNSRGGGIEIGYDYWYGGIVSNCIVAGNRADLQGGGIRAYGIYAEVVDCDIRGNAITNRSSSSGQNGGAGVWMADGRVWNCTIRNNRILDTRYDAGGAGAYLRSSASLRDCTITDNVASNNGGGIMLNGGPQVSGNTITGNQAWCVGNANADTFYGGGGIYMNYAVGALVSSNTIDGNFAAAVGGGICEYVGTGGYGTISNCTIRNNTSWYHGGGIGARSPSGGGRNYIVKCRIFGNALMAVNATLGGGGVAMTDGGTLMQYCVISNNQSASQGGGVQLWKTSSGYSDLVRNCLIVNNRAPNAGASYGGGGATLTGAVGLESCTVANNTAGSRGGGIYLRAAGCAVTNTICYYNTAPDGANWRTNTPSFIFTYSCTTPTNRLAGPGNVAGDPFFFDAAAGNYRLPRNSPCVNAGANQPWMTGAVDLDGNPRRDVFGGGVVDMGAYEFRFIAGTSIMIW